VLQRRVGVAALDQPTEHGLGLLEPVLRQAQLPEVALGDAAVGGIVQAGGEARVGWLELPGPVVQVPEIEAQERVVRIGREVGLVAGDRFSPVRPES
jgi:hypothetical protein